MKWAILILIASAFIAVNGENYHENEMEEHIMHPSFDEEQPIAKNIITAEEKTRQYWIDNAMSFVERQLKQSPNTKKAKNIIFFLGDGMSHATVSATRVAMGNENIQLSFEKFPYLASSKTYCVDEQTADSACTATAFLHGVKGNSGTIGVTACVRFADCADANSRNKYTESIGSWAQKAGKATGFVTTTRVTHATIAGLYANTPSRDWEDDAGIPSRCNSNNVTDIARQLVHGEVGSKLKVVLGGGSSYFIKNDEREHNATGRRRDGRNLINEWREARSTRQFVRNRQELMDVNATNVDQLFGLFSGSHVPYDMDIELDNRNDVPKLTEMTRKAIEVLQTEDNGFFLLVEGGRIDHAHHGTYARYAARETIEFQNAVELALSMVDVEETMIVVSADHSHVFTHAGYPVRGADVFGLTPSTAQDGNPFFILSFSNGPGHTTHRRDNARVDPRTLNLDLPWLEYPATVPLSSETHAADDVGIYAIGPWAHLFQGTVEQSVIPHVMAYASCIGNGPTIKFNLRTAMKENCECSCHSKNAKTSAHYKTFNLPQRFENPGRFHGYGVERDMNIAYYTSNSEYGKLPPSVHTVPLRYHPISYEFSRLAVTTRQRSLSLN